MNNGILDSLISEITNNQQISDKEQLLNNINKLKQEKLNVLFVGATGVGKSSTINAIFNRITSAFTIPKSTLLSKKERYKLKIWTTLKHLPCAFAASQ